MKLYKIALISKLNNYCYLVRNSLKHSMLNVLFRKFKSI